MGKGLVRSVRRMGVHVVEDCLDTRTGGVCERRTTAPGGATRYTADAAVPPDKVVGGRR